MRGGAWDKGSDEFGSGEHKAFGSGPLAWCWALLLRMNTEKVAVVLGGGHGACSRRTLRRTGVPCAQHGLRRRQGRNLDGKLQEASGADNCRQVCFFRDSSFSLFPM